MLAKNAKQDSNGTLKGATNLSSTAIRTELNTLSSLESLEGEEGIGLELDKILEGSWKLRAKARLAKE